MQVSRHRIYERTCKDEENGFLGEAMAVVVAMPKPGGWTRRQDGGRPFLKPRANATARARGHPAWRRMVLEYHGDRKGWERVYHERCNGEATNSAFKRLWGSRLYSRRRWNQSREVGLKVAAHNLCLLLRFRARIRLEREAQ